MRRCHRCLIFCGVKEEIPRGNRTQHCLAVSETSFLGINLCHAHLNLSITTSNFSLGLGKIGEDQALAARIRVSRASVKVIMAIRSCVPSFLNGFSCTRRRGKTGSRARDERWIYRTEMQWHRYKAQKLENTWAWITAVFPRNVDGLVARMAFSPSITWGQDNRR